MAGHPRRGDAERTTLRRLYLVTVLDDPVTVELRIERVDTDEVVHEDTYELPPGFEGVVVDRVWPNEPLRVMTRLVDDTGWNTYTTTDEGFVHLLSEASECGISYFVAAANCPDRSPTSHDETRR